MTVLADTLLINGTDLQSFRLIVEDFAGLHAPGTRRGSNVTIPGRRGDVYVPKVYGAYSFDVPVVILPDNSDGSVPATPQARRAQFVANLRGIEEIIDTGAVATLTRRLSTAAGHEDMTCSGEYAAGLAMTMLNPESGRTILSFLNLDGCWLDGSGGTHL